MTSKPDPSQHDLEIELAHLKQTNSLLQQLLITTSFEYRTPITIIIGYSKLLLETDLAGKLNQEQTKHVEHIRACANRLYELEEETRNILSIISLATENLSSVNLQLLFDKLSDIEVESITFEDNVSNIWSNETWLIKVIKTLLNFPRTGDPNRVVSIYPSSTNKHVIIQITLESKEEMSVWDHDERLLSIQNGIENLEGFIKWQLISKNILEFKLGLPVFKKPPNKNA